MTTLGLPLNVLRFFEPRPAAPYMKPLVKPSWERPKIKISGVAQFTTFFDDPKDDPPVERVMDKEERKRQKQKIREAAVQKKLEIEKPLYTPLEMLKDNPEATEDPMKTLFVGRLGYNVTQEQLRREFDEFGPIRKVTIAHNTKTGKPRGYAFIEFEREKDLRVAYTRGDCRKVDGRRVVVDVERGRTVPGWFPRRLGGGKGQTRKGAKADCITIAGRDRSPVRGGAPPPPEERSRGGAYADLDRPPPRRDDRDRYGPPSYYDRDRGRERERDRDRGGYGGGRSSYDRGGRGGGGYDRRDSYDRRDRDRSPPRGGRDRSPPRGGRDRGRERDRDDRGGDRYGGYGEVPPPSNGGPPRNYR